MSISSDDDDNSNTYNNLLPEMGAYNRVGLPGDMIGIITGSDGKINRNMLDPLQIFQIQVDAISRHLKDQKIKKILDEKDIQKMIEKSNVLKHVNYKNPTSYVLGYIASSGGTRITIEQFNYSSKLLEYVYDTSVLEPDILRYARLWMTMH
jgi:hypothetical protein